MRDTCHCCKSHWTALRALYISSWKPDQLKMATLGSMQSSSKLVVVERRAVDVVVLGNGSLAASAAYSLARRGKRVVLIPNLGFPKTATSASTVLRPLHIPHPKPELAQ